MTKHEKQQTELTLAAYWELRRAPKIELLREHFRNVEEGRETRLVLSPAIDWEKSVARIRGIATVPFQEKLEKELGRDLSMIRCFFGQKMLDSLRKDWLVQGHKMYFRAQEPDYEQVQQAVSELLLRQPLWEK